MTNRGITVSQLNNYIKQVFEAEEMLHNIEVIGEITGAKQSGNAVYFTLKDDGGIVDCVWWGVNMSQIPHDGTRVIARGTVSYWNKVGKIKFTVNKMEKFGLGDLMRMLQELHDKLKAEGLFDTAHKKQIPDIIKRVGVITSRSGAVIHDIITVATRRNPNIDIVLYPCSVQGVNAETEIIAGIEYFNRVKTTDVIIVARGGGSIEELQPFNGERLARTVFASKIPIISAVGHESDFTLIDFVSDLRAGTPSIASELVFREITHDRDRALQIWARLKSIVARKMDRATRTDIWKNLKLSTTNRLNILNGKIEILATRIEEKNPITILKRGFAKPNADLSTLKTGDEFEIMYYNSNKIKKGVATWKK